APPSERHAMGEERRCERVAREAAIGLAVEGERYRPAAVDAPAAGEAVRLEAHRVSLLAGRDEPASFVAVLRSRMSHCRQPRTCCQYSLCGPLGLSKRKTWSCHALMSAFPCSGLGFEASPP